MSSHPARWLKRAAVGIAALGAIALLSGAGYEQLMRRRALRAHPVPGRLVDVGAGRRIQIDCRGAGSPTVVLESGLDNLGSLSWVAVHDSLALTTRACAYSRAGVMWSDASPAPFDLTSMAGDLHRALAAAGESAPWVVVGHSIGGPYVMSFTHAYPSEVKGLVLVDASHPDQFARFHDIAGKSLAPPPGEVKLGAALAWTGLVRLLPVGATPESWPAETRRVSPPFLPLSVAGLAKETEAVLATLAAAREMRQLGDRPMVVLTAGQEQPMASLHAMGLTREQGTRLRSATRGMHDDQATWTRRGRHELVPDATHYIQFDRPDVVIRATREVVDAVRATMR
ncbi:MAG TPA: alpha/beta fold hydrolase [Gemmatimonadaceae bacterium]|nr:alpha/beta fold hydrolase [Gemmatimonadaceae bacterium]